MKAIKATYYILLLICLPLLIACGEGNKSKKTIENPVKDLVEKPIESLKKIQESNHTYDITINPGSANERHLKGAIENASKDDETINNFSAYSTTPNGKGIVLRIGNADILINGLFYYDNNGDAADLSDGSEDDSEERSQLMLTIAPPSEDVQNSISGKVELSQINNAVENNAGGVMGYTLKFDGKFEDYQDNISTIKGTVVVRIPNHL